MAQGGGGLLARSQSRLRSRLIPALLAFSLALALMISTAPAQAQAQTLDLVMLVDESGSLCGKSPPGDVALEVEGLITALESVVVPRVRAGADVRVGIISFGTKVSLRLGLTDVKTAKDRIIAALRAIKASPECGNTNLGGAINKAKAVLDGGTAPLRVINLVTDGEPTVPLTGPESYFQNACAAARDAGYEIWALGVGDVNEASLISCTGNAARYFYAPTIPSFVTVEQQKLRTILKPGVALDPDLWITKSASSDTVKAGEELSWTLIVGNAGPVSESAALVSDPLPAGLTLLSVVPSQGRCQSIDNVIDCLLGRLPSGGRATITLITKVAPEFAGTLSNTASVIGENEDLNKSNNKATATVRVANPNPRPPNSGDPSGEGITVDYKGELLERAGDLLDLAWELLEGLGTEVFTSLKDAKDWKVGAQAGLESALRYGIDLTTAIARARELIQTEAYNAERAAFSGLGTVQEALGELEGEVASLAVEIEQNTLAGNISQSYADLLIKRVSEEGRPEAPLLAILSLLSQKDLDLIEMDKLLEMAQEDESEALAWLATAATTCGTNTDCQRRAVKEALKALKGSIKLVREVEKSLWKIKDNIKAVKAWICGFKQLVIRAPTLEVPEEEPGPICPWCLPPLAGAGATELRIYSEKGAIRFAALGGGVQGMRARVFNLSGRAVFDSGLIAGNTLSWNTRNVANGVYLYTIEITTPAGTVRSEVQKLALAR